MKNVSIQLVKVYKSTECCLQ